MGTNNLNILVIGGGGREHALAWKIAQSPLVNKIFIAPGNAGTESVAVNVPIAADDVNGLLAFAKQNKIALTVVGPEAPLAKGVVDTFEAAGLLIAGPSQRAAFIEGSKVFMKEILTRANIPTARYEVHTNKDSALSALARFGERVVIKADGLAAGKGVIVAGSRAEAVEAIERMLVGREFGEAGAKIILEETLDGEEASILAFCDGRNVIMMPSSQDHKRIGDNDTGPNTGGMGAYSPAPVVTQEMERWVEKNIMKTTLAVMSAEGRPYKGILYAGLMVTKDGPKVLEFNARFGDPECQPLLMRMKSDIVPVLMGIAKGDISDVNVEWSEEPAVCVVMASKGYPGDYAKGSAITGLSRAGAMKDVAVFHAGTTKSSDGRIVTNGGRVLGVTAKGATIAGAIELAYKAVSHIRFDGAYHRNDIGGRALVR
ncbi:MAG: phosphoribosylamine--glycine ligase [Nitrospinae bacterium]|nr:phosphoribosylamine--glycine ligase [Nitrospinota bacterium]